MVARLLLVAALLPGCARLSRVEFDSADDRADVMVGSRWKARPWLYVDALVGERLERGEDNPVVGAAVSLRAPGTIVEVRGSATRSDDASVQCLLEVEF
jgi:hypothetical protein